MRLNGFIIILLLLAGSMQAQTDTALHRHHVLFGFDKHNITAGEARRLDGFLNGLSNLDSISIALTAHTDSIGSLAYNEMLSQKRLNSVQKYLREAGNNRIINATAHGETRPVADNASEEGRQYNRRVEVLVTQYIPEEIPEPEPVVYRVYGFVYDAETNEALQAEIETQFLNADSVTADFESGTTAGYQFEIPSPVSMRITAYAQGYVYQTKTLLRHQVTKENEVNFYLEKLEVGKEFVAENIYFYPDQPVVVPSSWPQLRKLYKLMAENPTLVIEIQGHVNWPSTYPFSIDRKTRQLSHDRALTVYNYLVEKGIDKNRMTYVGKSNTEMVYPHATTIEEYRQNMRVEIKIISY